MNKPIAGSVQKIAWTLSGLVVLIIGTAHMHADYSLSTLVENNSEAAHIVQESQSAAESFNAGWRYTKNGWQNRTEWQDPAPVSKPALHPAIVGALQLLISLGALIWFSTSKQRLARTA